MKAGNFFLQHGEKFVVAIFAISALGLAWGGLDALRTQSVTESQTPDSLIKSATQADSHIDREKSPPAEVVKAIPPLAETITPWRSAQPVEPTVVATLNKPMFEELAKRSQPDVFSVEDLRAVAGVAVVHVNKPKQPEPEAEPASEKDENESKRKPPRGRGRNANQDDSPADTFQTPASNQDQDQGLVVPFVVVTGLIPVEKQREEYWRRFLVASFRDEKRDSPLWSDYEVDRCVIEGGGPEQWEPVDLDEVAKTWDERWANTASDLLPMQYQLGDFEEQRPKSTPVAFNGPLPQRLDGGWGAEAVHPYFFAKALDEAPKPSVDTADDSVPQREDPGSQGLADNAGGPFPGMMPGGGRSGRGGRSSMPPGMMPGGGPGMAAPGMDMPAPGGPMPGMAGRGGGSRGMMPGMAGGSRGMMPGMAGGSRGMMPGMSPDMDGGPGGSSGMYGRGGSRGMTPGMGPGMAPDMDGGAGASGMGLDGSGVGGFTPRPRGDGIEFKQFRFIDTNVEAGKSYRYRVRLKVWNPNFGVPARHLSDVAVAADQKLTSSDSVASSIIRIPDATTLLAGTVRKADAKKQKAGSYDVFVLAAAEDTGNYSLRSVLLDLGGIANIDSQLNKPGDFRSRGANVVTDRMLVDATGRQEVREDIKGNTPPEPLDMLFLRPDGGFEIVSAADSEPRVAQYRDELPEFDEKKRDTKPEAPASPFDNPFAPSGPKKGR